MSRGQTGANYGASMPSPMFKLPSTPTTAGTSMPSPMQRSRSPLYAGCAGCAANYGATFGNNDYGRVYDPRSPSFAGPVFGNGPYDTLRVGAGGKSCGFDCTSSGSCGAGYTHPQGARAGRVGCVAPECTSNADAVAAIYTRGTTYGCSANPLADRLMDHKYVNAVSNWRNKGPRARFMDIVSEFGEADWLVNKPGGEAVWNNRAFYARIVLRDESVGHENHCDFLYATVGNMALPPAGLPLVAQLSQNLLYDQLRQELTARGNSMREIVPLLLVANDVAYDADLSLADAKTALPKMLQDAQTDAKYVEIARALEEQVQEAAKSNVARPNFNC